jgi:hypothetical protein
MAKTTKKLPKAKKRSFSGFNLASAYKQLGIKTLLPWVIQFPNLEPTDFFTKRLERLHREHVTFSISNYA